MSAMDDWQHKMNERMRHPDPDSMSALRERNAALVAALEEIINPLGVLQQRAKANGDQLSSMAHEICNSRVYLQDIARRALVNQQSTEKK